MEEDQRILLLVVIDQRHVLFVLIIITFTLNVPRDIGMVLWKNIKMSDVGSTWTIGLVRKPRICDHLAILTIKTFNVLVKEHTMAGRMMLIYSCAIINLHHILGPLTVIGHIIGMIA